MVNFDIDPTPIIFALENPDKCLDCYGTGKRIKTEKRLVSECKCCGHKKHETVDVEKPCKECSGTGLKPIETN